MRKTYQIFAFLIATEVVIQAAAIAYALAGLGKWVEDDGGVLNKAVPDADDGPDFRGVGGFELHGINGMMIIPLITLLFLIISFFAKLPGASKRAGLIALLVIAQVVLGLTSHSVPLLAALHAINGFVLFSLAVMTGVKAGKSAPVVTSPAAEPVIV
ncbi:MAG: hypothetical protein ABR549_18575 [Mycobacteriales bacterium]